MTRVNLKVPMQWHTHTHTYAREHTHTHTQNIFKAYMILLAFLKPIQEGAKSIKNFYNQLGKLTHFPIE